jgi:hypothetical protein
MTWKPGVSDANHTKWENTIHDENLEVENKAPKALKV